MTVTPFTFYGTEDGAHAPYFVIYQGSMFLFFHSRGAIPITFLNALEKWS